MLGKTGTLTKPETAFSPAAIPGFALWLVGNKSPVTMNGSNVSQCNDISGNGNHATQGTATKQPPLGMISGLPAIDFTGDNLDVLSIAATTSINNIWTGGAYISLVVNFDQVKDPAEFERFLHKDSASSDGWFL
ncbi:MAG: hypothetical protein J4G10_07800, partial [Alphaproteobacteria bacterium]|nr:hypothetical protein [Alphaproteobacteria bacterium]